MHRKHKHPVVSIVYHLIKITILYSLQKSGPSLPDHIQGTLCAYGRVKLLSVKPVKGKHFKSWCRHSPRLLVVLSACSPLAWHTSAPGESNLHLSVVNCRHGTLENNTHTALHYLPACANDVGIQMQMDTKRLSFWACYTSMLHRLVFKQSRRHKINRLAAVFWV